MASEGERAAVMGPTVWEAWRLGGPGQSDGYRQLALDSSPPPGPARPWRLARRGLLSHRRGSSQHDFGIRGCGDNKSLWSLYGVSPVDEAMASALSPSPPWSPAIPGACKEKHGGSPACTLA